LFLPVVNQVKAVVRLIAENLENQKEKANAIVRAIPSAGFQVPKPTPICPRYKIT
jgi:hypothetical protein